MLLILSLHFSDFGNLAQPGHLATSYSPTDSVKQKSRIWWPVRRSEKVGVLSVYQSNLTGKVLEVSKCSLDDFFEECETLSMCHLHDFLKQCIHFDICATKQTLEFRFYSRIVSAINFQTRNKLISETNANFSFSRRNCKLRFFVNFYLFYLSFRNFAAAKLNLFSSKSNFTSFLQQSLI